MEGKKKKRILMRLQHYNRKIIFIKSLSLCLFWWYISRILFKHMVYVLPSFPLDRNDKKICLLANGINILLYIYYIYIYISGARAWVYIFFINPYFFYYCLLYYSNIFFFPRFFFKKRVTTTIMISIYKKKGFKSW